MPEQEKVYSTNEDSDYWEDDFREACVDAFAYHDPPGDTVTIYEGVKVFPKGGRFMLPSDEILERMAESAWEELGECAENWLQNVDADGQEKLRSLLGAAFDVWAAQNGHDPNFYEVEQVRAIVVQRSGDRFKEIRAQCGAD